MPTLQNSADIAGANQIFGGTHNSAPNQVGVTPADSDLLNHNQAIIAMIIRNAAGLLPKISSWTGTGTSGGTASGSGSRNYFQINTSSTTGSSGVCSLIVGGLTNGTGAGLLNTNTVDFSKNFWMVARFFGNGLNAACPNTVYRFSIGKTTSTAGAPTSAAVGVKVVFDTAGVGHVFGEIYGSSLQTSGSSLATVSLGVGTVIIINSQAGTVYYYVNGAFVGSLTAGPSTATSTGTYYLEHEILNSGDATPAFSTGLELLNTEFYVEN